MKKKLDKATRKKIILAVVIIAGLICGYKIIDAASYQFVKTKAEIYLCIKYDAKPSEIELVDYKHSGIYWDEYKVFLIIPKWTDFSFEFKYNDRNVMVFREDGKFYDDYQFDEIEKWCTEWLKENVDERIVGFNISNTNIKYYYKNLKKKSIVQITKDETEIFLNFCTEYDSKSSIILIHIYEGSNKLSGIINNSSSIYDELYEKLNSNENIIVSRTNIKLPVYKKNIDKSSPYAWCSTYKIDS